MGSAYMFLWGELESMKSCLVRLATRAVFGIGDRGKRLKDIEEGEK
jgi:hypothetical protein